MPDSLVTVADLLKINDRNISEIDVSDLLQDAPFLRALSSETASNGTSHKYLKETGAPVVGFRDANDGRLHSKSADTLVTIDLKIFDASYHVDKAIADAYQKGGPQALIAREGVRHMRSGFAGAEKQLLYGTSQDAKGFTGLTQAATIDNLADGMVYDGGGVGTDTDLTSVYLVRSGMSDLSLILGQDGNIELGESFVQFVEGATGKFPAYMTAVGAWMALQLGSIYSIGRIANLSAGASKTLNDDKIYEALSLFPASRQPTHLVMNRRSAKQLRASRTATNATGTPAPRPTEVDGIPIVVTDHITNTEAHVA